MTEERKQELRQLLQEAMQTVIIEAPEGYEPISFEKYKEYAKAFRKSYRPDLSFYLFYYMPNIDNEAVKSKLFNFIKEELADYILHDESAEPPWTYSICPAKIAIRGANMFIASLNSVLEKLLEISIASGADKAISALDKCTRETSGTFQKIALLHGPIRSLLWKSGTEDSKEIRIFDGVRLVFFPLNPSELPPYLFDEAFNRVLTGAGPEFFRQKTVLIIDHTVSPLFSKPSDENENPFEIKIKSAEFPNFDIQRFCHAFSLVTNRPVETVLQWSYIDEDELFNPQRITTEIIDQRIPKNDYGAAIIDDTHIEKIKKLYRELTNLSSDVAGNLRIPIDRWIKSATEDNPVDKIIDLGIAFESLYLSGIKSKNEIRFRFSLHAAWHLGEDEDKEHREELMKKFKAIYDWRSTVVHTGKLPKKGSGKKKKSYTQEEVREFIRNAQDLCRDSILKILKDGEFPDWNNLILG